MKILMQSGKNREARCHRRRAQAAGFTLLELSVVLVIIGMIIGGVLMGQSLIRETELQAVIKEKNQLVATVNMFQSKYSALPGDMPNATSYWGDVGNCWSGNTLTGRATCNGNGNGWIEGVTIFLYESILAFHHLADADMAFPLSDPGNTITQPLINGTVVLVPGFNIPKSRYPGAGYAMVYVALSATNCSLTTANGENWAPDQCSHNVIVFGSTPWSGAGVLPSRAFGCMDIAMLDGKFDDGLPSTGNIQTAGANSGSTTCWTPFTDYPTATYVTSSGSAVLVFPHEIDPPK